MRRALMILLLSAAAAAIPVTASAVVSQTDQKNAAKFCKALRADMTAVTFKQAYGTNKNHSNAFGKCVSKYARASHENHKTAVSQCKSEKAKPLGKCVSAKEDEAEQQDHDAIVGAAKQCRDERAQDAAAFRERYGTNHNKRNAFGKCVSKRAASAS